MSPPILNPRLHSKTHASLPKSRSPFNHAYYTPTSPRPSHTLRLLTQFDSPHLTLPSPCVAATPLIPSRCHSLNLSRPHLLPSTFLNSLTYALIRFPHPHVTLIPLALTLNPTLTSRPFPYVSYSHSYFTPSSPFNHTPPLTPTYLHSPF
jgi:hypothetical protein